MKKKYWSCLFCVLALLTLSGCHKVRFTDPKKITYDTPDHKEPTAKHPRTALGLSTQHKIHSLNPNKVQSGYELAALNMLGEGLFRLNDQGDILPGVCNGKIERSNNQITLHLNPEARWSNNQPVKAEDFVYAWQELVRPENHHFYGNILNDIVAQATNIQKGDSSVDQLGITALDDHTLLLTLEKETLPTQDLKRLLAFPALFPINKDFVQHIDYTLYGDKSANSLSNGPYSLENWAPEWDTWSYVRNEMYPEKSDYPTQKITVQYAKNLSIFEKSYQQQILDMTFSKKTSKNNQAFLHPKHTVLHLNGNSNNKKHQLLTDETFRALLCQSIDQSALKENQSKEADNVQLTSSMDPLTPDLSLENPSSSLDAQSTLSRLLKENHYQAFELNLITDDTADSVQLANQLKDQWQNQLSHLTINVLALPESTLLTRYQEGDYDLALLNHQSYDNQTNRIFYTPYLNSAYQQSLGEDYASYSQLLKEQPLTQRLEDTTCQKAQQFLQNHYLLKPLLRSESYYHLRDQVVTQSPFQSSLLINFKGMAYQPNDQTIPILPKKSSLKK